jgi:hypothetical protein
MSIPSIVSALKDLQIQHAVNALKAPDTSCAEFTFGKAVGLHAGLELAIRLITEIQKDESERMEAL